MLQFSVQSHSCPLSIIFHSQLAIVARDAVQFGQTAQSIQNESHVIRNESQNIYNMHTTSLRNPLCMFQNNTRDSWKHVRGQMQGIGFFYLFIYLFIAV